MRGRGGGSGRGGGGAGGGGGGSACGRKARLDGGPTNSRHFLIREAQSCLSTCGWRNVRGVSKKVSNPLLQVAYSTSRDAGPRALQMRMKEHGGLRGKFELTARAHSPVACEGQRHEQLNGTGTCEGSLPHKNWCDGAAWLWLVIRYVSYVSLWWFWCWCACGLIG